MRTPKTTLTSAVTRLEQAVGTFGMVPTETWAERVEQALAAIEEGIRRQDAILDSPNGSVVDVGNGRVPAAGLDRQREHLHDDLNALLADTRDLRERLRQARKADSHEDGLRRRAAELLETLNRYEHDEASLMLESVTTDIGAGD